MKLYTKLLITFLISSLSNAQAPEIEWQKCLGGESLDYGYSINQTVDGGYIVAGSTQPNNQPLGWIQGTHDFMVVKLSSTGVIEWQKFLGGSGSDRAFSINQTVDGGYIAAGYTESNDGDVSGNHGAQDYWVVKLSSTGIIEWQKALGGTSYDIASSINQTSDGGYILVGYTQSNDGDVIGNHGSYDGWVVKLSSTGVIEWQKCLGGSDGYYDYTYSINQTSDGGYIVAGSTDSNNGDVSGNNGYEDAWIVKLSSTGVIQWQKCLGGTGSDSASSINLTSDGGYIVAGYSRSNDGDVSGNHGYYDFWVVKLSLTGVIEWQKCLEEQMVIMLLQ